MDYDEKIKAWSKGWRERYRLSDEDARITRAVASQIGNGLRELGHKNDSRDIVLIRRIEDLEKAVAELRAELCRPRKWWQLW